jgi:predicted DNA-binding protein (UPF0278 family)
MIGKFYLALQDTAEENKMAIDSGENNLKTIHELEEVINEVCPGSIKKPTVYKEKVGIEELKDAVLKMPKKGYKKLIHAPDRLIKSIMDVLYSDGYGYKGKIDSDKVEQFIGDCKNEYNKAYANGVNGLKEDVKLLIEHFDNEGLIMIGKK